MIQAQERAMSPASKKAEIFSTLPWPYVWSSSAGLSETRTEKNVRVAAARSSPEWAASDSTPSEPEMIPAASFNAVMQVAASAEFSATRRFKAEFSAGLDTDVFAAARF